MDDLLKLRLDDVIVDMSIGIYPFERFAEHPNRLKISIELHADIAPGPLAKAEMIDYAYVYRFLKTLPGQGHVDLLETLADQITENCFSLQRVKACRVVILKISLLNDCAGAGIDVVRTRKSWTERNA